jgi:hypothetical protein
MGPLESDEDLPAPRNPGLDATAFSFGESVGESGPGNLLMPDENGESSSRVGQCAPLDAAA